MAQFLATVLKDEKTSLRVLKELAENSFDSVLISDASKGSRILYANDTFKTLTGFEPSEVIGKTPRILQRPATDKKVLERLRKAL